MTSLERDALILAEYSRLFGDSETCHSAQTVGENAEIATTRQDVDTMQNTEQDVSRTVSVLELQRAEMDKYGVLFDQYMTDSD